MEIVILQRLKQHLGMFNILTSEKYVFRDAVSTDNAIYKHIQFLGPSFTKIIQNYEFKIKCEREFLF
jgi:hypothetical protein